MYVDEIDTVEVELQNLPTVKYPEEYLAELDVRSQILRHQIAIGEVVPRPAAELIAEWEKKLG